jgi:hypothetical protein
VETFNQHNKSIHLTLEVKTFLDNSTPTMGSSTESNTYKPGLPTDNCHRHHRKEEKGNLHTKSYKAKLEQLCSARLAHRDQAVRLLDMQRLQVIKTHKPTTVIFKHL